jgi:2-phospho-L-lactate guanylyltransferase (CobY/MobA/RfbA family)
MARIVTLTVEFHADPELPDDVAQAMLNDVIDAVNEHAYVSNVQVEASCPSSRRAVADGNLPDGAVSVAYVNNA